MIGNFKTFQIEKNSFEISNKSSTKFHKVSRWKEFQYNYKYDIAYRKFNNSKKPSEFSWFFYMDLTKFQLKFQNKIALEIFTYIFDSETGLFGCEVSQNLFSLYQQLSLGSGGMSAGVFIPLHCLHLFYTVRGRHVNVRYLNRCYRYFHWFCQAVF